MANGNLYNSPFESQFDPDRAQLFIITNLLRGVHTCDLVKVLDVQPISGKVGFVTVQPLVQETDTNDVVLEQTPIYNVPFMRYQGGTSAVILDPVAGDIGLAIFAENDITNVKQTQAQGPAATQRVHSTADALYIGGVLNPDPTQWVKFSTSGIDINTVGALTMEATTINAQATGNITIAAQGTLTLTGQGQTLVISSTGGNSTAPITAPDFKAPNANLNTHVHSDPQGGNTGTPHN